MTARPGWRAALREALLGDGDRALREVIRQLDLPEDDPPDNLAALALARAILALGPIVGARLEASHPVHVTTAAAAAFAKAPADETWDDFFRAATASYPFGPGDGCHCTLPAARHGERGGGCRSGSGTLRSIAEEVGVERVMQVVRAALVPWLDTLA